MLNVWTMMAEVHCLAHARLEGSCIARCEWVIVVVLWFLADGFWYKTCFGILHSECCGNSMNEEGFALQCVSIFQFSEIHYQKSALIACFVQAYCILHVQLVFRLVPESVRRSIQKNVSSCFLLDVFSTWFETIEQVTVVS